MNTTTYLAARNVAVDRDPRGKTHAMVKGDEFALCSQLVVTPRFPQRTFDPAETGVCVKCIALVAGPSTPVLGERAQRAAYDKAKRERYVDDDDPAMRAFMLAMHTGGINNVRGNYERATQSMVSYRTTVGGLRRWVNGRAWDRIDPSEIHAYLNRPKANGEPRKNRTITQNHTALCTFYNFLIDRDMIDVRSPMRHVGRPRATEEDNQDIGRLPAEQAAWSAVMASKLSMDDLLCLGLCYFAGLRISEVTIVRPQKINPLLQEMDFWRPKSRQWQVDFGYGAYVEALKLTLPNRADGADEWLEVMTWMAKYRANDDTLVVSGNVNEPEDWWNNRLEHHVLPKAGLDPKAFTPHRLRHNFGHNMIDAGILPHELKEAMGHKSLDTTDIYIKGVGRAKKFTDRLRAQRAGEAAGEVVTLNRRRHQG